MNEAILSLKYLMKYSSLHSGNTGIYETLKRDFSDQISMGKNGYDKQEIFKKLKVNNLE